jgi:hypothetical protein
MNEPKINWKTSKFFKIEIGTNLLYQRNYLGVFTEYRGADLFGIKRSLYTTEIEIKTSKHDLQSEIRSIDYAKNGGVGYGYAGGKLNKYSKHLGYLKEQKDGVYGNWYKMHVPNEFYFAVPSNLVIDAIKGTDGTPYGVISIGKYKGGYQNKHEFWGINYYKKAEKIHKVKITHEEMILLIRKASTEVFVLREEKFNKENSAKII